LRKSGFLCCSVTDHLLACQVTIPPTKADGVPHQALIDAVADFADVDLRFRREQASFELSASAGGVLDFTSGPVNRWLGAKGRRRPAVRELGAAGHATVAVSKPLGCSCISTLRTAMNEL
jgi:hypothetical protein